MRTRPDTAALERRLLTWATSVVFLIGLPVALLWLALPHPQAADDFALVLVFAGAEFLGLALLVRRLRIPPTIFAAVIAASNALAGVAIYLTGVPDSGLELFYLWLTPFAFVFTTLRMALLQVVLAAVGYGVALMAVSGAGDPAAHGLGRWSLVVASIVAVGLLTRRISASASDSEVRFRLAFESSLIGMALVDPSGDVLDANDALCRLLGRAREETAGRPLFVESCGHEFAGRTVDRSWFGPSGEPVHAVIASTPVVDKHGRLQHVLCQVVDVTARVRAEQERADAHASVAALARQRGRLVADALAGEDQIRRGLSESLHEGVLQEMLAARQDVAEAVTHPDRSKDALQRALKALDGCGADLRSAVFELHPLALHHGGLASALEAVVRGHAERRGFMWRVDADPHADGVADDLLLSLTRELVTNAAKHAEASSVTVELRRRDDGLELVVRDDGCGMAADRPDRALRMGHIGLASGVQRVQALGGSLTVQSRPGHGTTVVVSLPVHQPDPLIGGFPGGSLSPTLVT